MKAGLVTGLAISLTSALSAHPVSLEITGNWTLTVHAGQFTPPGGGKPIAVKQAVLHVPPQAVVHVRGEKHDKLPVFADKGGGWSRGARLNALITQECTAGGALVPQSVVVRTTAGKVLTENRDYRLDGTWGTVGRTTTGALGAHTPVVVDYDYYPHRLDAVAVAADGSVRLVEGKPFLGAHLPPALARGETCIARVWLSGPVEKLTSDNLFPIDDTPVPKSEWAGAFADYCPTTYAKLRAGEPVRIVAWGDSVTHGGGVRNNRAEWYQYVFLKRLQARYPKSHITLTTAAWPGGNSTGYLNAPPGGKYDFRRDVLAPKPDLVTIEFVNDSYLHGAALQEHYGEIMDILRGSGAEVILITPHFVRPDWMKVKSLKFDDDPRPYVKGLREFARKNHVAVADASLLWGHLWHEGIPYVTLLANSINHPDARGHRLFADALMGLFP